MFYTQAGKATYERAYTEGNFTNTNNQFNVDMDINTQTVSHKQFKCKPKQHHRVTPRPKGAIWSPQQQVYHFPKQQKEENDLCCQCHNPKIRRTLFIHDQTSVSYVIKTNKKRRKRILTTVLNTTSNKILHSADRISTSNAQTQTVNCCNVNRDNFEEFDINDPEALHNIVQHFMRSMITILIFAWLLEAVLNIWLERFNLEPLHIVSRVRSEFFPSF